MNSKMKALLIEINQLFTTSVAKRAKAEGLTTSEFFRLIVHHACLNLATVILISVKADQRDSFIQSVVEQIKDNCNNGIDFKMPDMN